MNYGQLKTHFEALLNRSDNTAALTTTFIDQGIARIQRQLRTPLNEDKATYDIDGVTKKVSVPSDFLEIISLYMGKYELQRISMKQYRELQDSGAQGTPKYFCREQQDLLLHPAPTSGTLTLYYYGEFGALSDDDDENNLSKVAADCIIYSALTFASDYYLDERAQLFEQKYATFMTELQEQANDQELNGSTNAIQPAYSFGDY